MIIIHIYNKHFMNNKEKIFSILVKSLIIKFEI